MATHGGPRRDFQALEFRRQRAARLFAGGQKTQGAIARLLDVSRQSVMRWYHAWRASGRAGLKAAGRAGRKPRLESRQLAAIETALHHGPVAAGFTTTLWTLPRVAVVIERVRGSAITPATCGGFSVGSTGRSSGPPSGRRNGTTRRFSTGSTSAGPR